VILPEGLGVPPNKIRQQLQKIFRRLFAVSQAAGDSGPGLQRNECAEVSPDLFFKNFMLRDQAKTIEGTFLVFMKRSDSIV